jgi:hypothetical protein
MGSYISRTYTNQDFEILENIDDESIIILTATRKSRVIRELGKNYKDVLGTILAEYNSYNSGYITVYEINPSWIFDSVNKSILYTIDSGIEFESQPIYVSLLDF